MAKGATTTVPIVFATGSDPLRTDLVASLNRGAGALLVGPDAFPTSKRSTWFLAQRYPQLSYATALRTPKGVSPKRRRKQRLK